MSVVELRADDGAAQPVSAGEAVPVIGPPDRIRPNMAGDLPSLFRAAPMFRRAVAGYDRFQVDSYVQWAEDELATADREREHLVIRHLSTQAALDEARQLLSHSSSGGEFLQVSRRIGTLLASAADEAESIRAEAEADRSAGATEAARLVADATEVLAGAEADAERVILETAAEVEAMTTEAGRILDEAERTSSEARADAEARLDKVRRMEQLAAEKAARIRQQAADDASAALSAARDEVVRMLSTGREERRRADAAAAAAREVLERDAEIRCAALRAEIAVLEQRRSVLSALEAAPEPVASAVRRPLETQLRELRQKLHWGSRSVRLP
jgi:cell division septum initiation protein DivIVA